MKTALLFPGQGAQVVGMGAELAGRSKRARELFAAANDILGYDLLRLCTDGPQEDLNRTQHAQPALFVHSLALLQEWEEASGTGWEDVVAVAGLSLGEYTAVTAAGGMSFEDGLKLVKVRGESMQEAAERVDSTMASILGLAPEDVASICAQVSTEETFVRPANFLCPGNIAVSGHTAAVEAAQREAERRGAMKTVRLAVAGAFHTSLMAPAVPKLQAALEQVEMQPLRVPVVSNVDADYHREPSELRSLLARQVTEPVRWEESLRRLIDDGVEQFVEIGAGRVLTGTLKRIDRKKKCVNITG